MKLIWNVNEVISSPPPELARRPILVVRQRQIAASRHQRYNGRQLLSVLSRSLKWFDGGGGVVVHAHQPSSAAALTTNAIT